MGDLLLLAITCVCRLHWSARRGSWSRVFRRGVDFIPVKFLWRPSCLALGVGALSGGARAVGSPTASAWFPVQVARFPADLLYADTRRLPMAEVDPLGDSRRGACKHLPTRPSFVSWSSRAYWPIGSPIAGRQEPCPRARRSRRGAGSPLPGARYLRSTLCACRPHLPRRAPTVPGVNVIRPGGVQTRDPQRWLRSPHPVCSPASYVPVGMVRLGPWSPRGGVS